MCPISLATLGLVVSGTIATGGLAALAVKVSRKKNHGAETTPNEIEVSSENVNTHGR